MKRQKNISQMKEKEKSPQNPKEVESSHLSNKKIQRNNHKGAHKI